MQPRKKEIEEAWKVHDHRPEDFGCQKNKDWKKYEKLGHSHFNPVCKTMVIEYAKAHPIPRQYTEKPKPVIEQCVSCRKKRSADKLLKVPKEDQSGAKHDEILMEFICPKCHKKRERRKELDEKRRIKELERMERLEKEAPDKCTRDPKSFGHFDKENTNCMDMKCGYEVRELCLQKTGELNKKKEAEKMKGQSTLGSKD